MKRTDLKIGAALFFLLLSYTAVSADSGPLGTKTGNHFGEERFLEYWIEYLDPLGVTAVDEAGITFSAFDGSVTHEEIILPEKYFGEYPLYFGDGTLRFDVHIRNTGKRTYQNLLIIAAQEFLNVEGGAGEPLSVPASEWSVETLAPSQEVVLSGSIVIPSIGPSGIDQTHLQILHRNGAGGPAHASGGGEIIVDSPQAGLWCPQLTP